MKPVLQGAPELCGSSELLHIGTGGGLCIPASASLWPWERAKTWVRQLSAAEGDCQQPGVNGIWAGHPELTMVCYSTWNSGAHGFGLLFSADKGPAM